MILPVPSTLIMQPETSGCGHLTILVHQVRLELTRPHEHWNLNPGRLPIPPLMHFYLVEPERIELSTGKVQTSLATLVHATPFYLVRMEGVEPPAQGFVNPRSVH